MTRCASPLALDATVCVGDGCDIRSFCERIALGRADEILRDVGRLGRAWTLYQRTYPACEPGQLELFSFAEA
jgi:hypothetical protein